MLMRSLLAAAALSMAAGAASAEEMIKMDLSTGPVVVKLRPDLAPKHVERIEALTKEGFYDGRKHICGARHVVHDPRVRKHA